MTIRQKRKLYPTLLLVVALAICWQLYAQKAKEILVDWNLDRLASNQQLIDKFEWTVFRQDSDTQPGFLPDRRLNKWQLPIRVLLKNREAIEYREQVVAILRDLSRLSGLSIQVVNGKNPQSANVAFYMTSPEDTEVILRAENYSQDNIDFIEIGGCSFITSNINNHIQKDVIVILNHYEDAFKKRCIVEEFTQSLGLYADTDIIWNSVMNEKLTHPFDRLPLNDKIMVRTLYDKRLKPGMTRKEAMPIVRKIIPELVAAVKEHGEQALHQSSAQSN
ncbi:MAG: DUF2927 domain-containing protein [Rhodospirillaceae bacterium]|nr:DUF2927 domain-containing protein [Rhodospirillaceae bacterium]